MKMLREYCIEIAKEANYDLETLTDIVISGVESENSTERELVWNLMKQAGNPLYSRQSFQAAAQLALDIATDGDEPPRAA